MRTYYAFCIALVLLCNGSLLAQHRKALEEAERRQTLEKTDEIKDRAGGTHNKSNFSWFFENRGKLYPRRASQGFGAEWPIGSGHEYVYRVNPLVGIPGNVIQGRFTTDEEWEAAAGYSNRDSAKIAFSDDPKSWPSTGWPVRDAAGKPIFVSNQDSYCVYNDSTNSKKQLGIQVNQIGYAFSQKRVKDILYFTFLVINRSQRTYDSLYFGFYGDIDVGNISGGVPEWSDDKFTFDRSRNLITYYDAKGYSREWLTPSGQVMPTGYFGMALLETPQVNGRQPGITDLHYNTNGADDDVDIDSVLYGLLSSAPSLYASSLSGLYFHPGSHLPDLHYDDVNTIPAAGMDVTTWEGSGPYTIHPSDTLKFVTAWIAGLTPEDYDSTYAHALALYQGNYAISQPPPTPKVTFVAGDGRATIVWDNRSELMRDQLTGKNTFQGYRVYRSIDRALHWDQIDRNAFPAAGADPVPIADFDRVDGVGKDKGLQYTFVDSGLTNGSEYWYSVTAYAVQDDGHLIETARGNTPAEQNIAVVVPRWNAVGRSPVSATPAVQTGSGAAKVKIGIVPCDMAEIADKSYEIGFAPVPVVEQGSFLSRLTAAVDTAGSGSNDVFSIAFASPTSYRLRDLTRGILLDSAGQYGSGTAIRMAGLRVTFTDTSAQADDRPKVGDSVTVRTGITMASAGATVLSLRPFTYDTRYSTSGGLIVAVSQMDTAAASGITYRDKFTFSTKAATVDQGAVAAALASVKVVPNPYMVSSQYEQEYGALRREPIRQLKFTHLPPRCTIYIFTLDGDKVKTIVHDSTDGTETWDLRASGGREIAAGIYLYLVKTDTAERLDRFAVIK